MSREQLIAKELDGTLKNNSLNKSEKSKVNINDLLYKVRQEKSKEKKENYMLLSLVVGVLTLTGIIASF